MTKSQIEIRGHYYLMKSEIFIKIEENISTVIEFSTLHINSYALSFYFAPVYNMKHCLYHFNWIKKYFNCCEIQGSISVTKFKTLYQWPNTMNQKRQTNNNDPYIIKLKVFHGKHWFCKGMGRSTSLWSVNKPNLIVYLNAAL